MKHTMFPNYIGAFAYSGIEMALNPQGMFRVRVLDSCDRFTTQDVVTIKYCPMCGRKFRRDK